VVDVVFGGRLPWLPEEQVIRDAAQIISQPLLALPRRCAMTSRPSQEP